MKPKLKVDLTMVAISLIALILSIGALIITYQTEKTATLTTIRQENLMRRVMKLEYLRGIRSSYIGIETDDK